MIIIDQEHALDVPQIETLLDVSFGKDRKSKSSYSIRENVDPIHHLNLVLRSEGKILGTVRFWPAIIRDALGGVNHDTLLLGPLAVHPSIQGSGRGRLLLRAALENVDAKRYSRIMLVGCLKYYGEFGFRSVKPKYISMPGNRDAGRLLVREWGSLPSLPTVGQLMAIESTSNYSLRHDNFYPAMAQIS
jgi:predicted N-acetyltransferase YhbS